MVFTTNCVAGSIVPYIPFKYIRQSADVKPAKRRIVFAAAETGLGHTPASDRRPPPFVGRDVESTELKAVLQPGTVCCVLAAHTVQQLQSHFPDGILWARLDAANPMALLDTFARAYGQDVSGFTEWDDRTRVVRDLLARKRALFRYL